jgi:hypothetical protein
MEPLKKEALHVIASLPDDADRKQSCADPMC